jgi:hypothetical protein
MDSRSQDVETLPKPLNHLVHGPDLLFSADGGASAEVDEYIMVSHVGSFDVSIFHQRLDAMMVFLIKKNVDEGQNEFLFVDAVLDCRNEFAVDASREDSGFELAEGDQVWPISQFAQPLGKIEVREVLSGLLASLTPVFWNAYSIL